LQQRESGGGRERFMGGGSVVNRSVRRSVSASLIFTNGGFRAQLDGYRHEDIQFLTAAKEIQTYPNGSVHAHPSFQLSRFYNHQYGRQNENVSPSLL
jgi:hypothetical protein